MIWLVLNCLFGTLCFVSLVAAGWLYSHRLDLLDRVAMGGLAGSFLLTTPALFWPTPFDPWAFSLSRAFLCSILLKRFLVPVIWCYIGKKRQSAQIKSSGDSLRDRMHDKL